MESDSPKNIEDIDNEIEEKVGNNGYGEVAGGKNLIDIKNVSIYYDSWNLSFDFYLIKIW